MGYIKKQSMCAHFGGYRYVLRYVFYRYMSTCKLYIFLLFSKYCHKQ